MNLFEFGKGVLIFSAVVTLIFGIFAALGQEYNAPETQQLNELAGRYNIIGNYSSNDNQSVFREMGLEMDNSNPTSLELSAFFLRGGIEAAKSIKGVVTTPINMVYMINNDLGGLVPKVLIDLIIGMMIMGITIILLVMFMRSRPDTN